MLKLATIMSSEEDRGVDPIQHQQEEESPEEMSVEQVLLKMKKSVEDDRKLLQKMQQEFGALSEQIKDDDRSQRLADAMAALAVSVEKLNDHVLGLWKTANIEKERLEILRSTILSLQEVKNNPKLRLGFEQALQKVVQKYASLDL
jgi:hypothetical protein